jgi:hypothetical protein
VITRARRPASAGSVRQRRRDRRYLCGARVVLRLGIGAALAYPLNLGGEEV